MNRASSPFFVLSVFGLSALSLVYVLSSSLTQIPTSSSQVAQVASVPALVQAASFNGSGADFSQAFTSNTTAGNTIIVALRKASVPVTSPGCTISDTTGNTYSLAVTNDQTGDHRDSIWYAKNIAGGATIINVSCPLVTGTSRMAIHEFSGLDKTSPFDQSAIGNGVGTSATIGSMNLSTANGLVFGACSVSNTATFTPGSGYTLGQSVAGKIATEYKAVSSGGSHAPDFSLSVSDTWTCVGATFKAGASGSSGTGPRLLAHWNFDENFGTTLADSSGNGNSGTLTNGPTWIAGKIGRALNFDGINDVVMVNTTLDVPTLPFTFAAWVNPTNRGSWAEIFSKRDGYSVSDMRIDWELDNSTGNVKLHHAAASATFNYAPPIGTWTHLAVVARSGATDLYVNGVLQQTVGAITLGTDAGAQVRIGDSGQGDPFSGGIDDMRIYNYALSTSEITGLFNLGGGSTPTDTTAPTFSNIQVTNITTTGATISWTTNELSDSQVQYGLTQSYGNNTTLDTARVTLHSQNLTGLLPNTVYNYQVLSRDVAGNPGSSGNRTFQTLNTSVSAPTISSHPANQTVNVGQSATFNVTASGNPAPTYQWQRNGVAINGATSASYTLSNIQLSDSGATFRAVVSNSVGNVTSNAATLTVNAPDTTAPVVTAFSIPSTSSSLTISISSLTATDATGVTGYMVTESSTAPLSSASGWTSNAPSTYIVSSEGSKTLYAWAKDAAGNVSTSRTASVTVTLPPPPPPGTYPWSNILSPSRAIDWRHAGIPGGIPTRTTVCANVTAGESTASIQTKINNCPANQVVQFGPGTFNLTSGIYSNNKPVVLRGTGPEGGSTGTTINLSGGNILLGNGTGGMGTTNPPGLGSTNFTGVVNNGVVSSQITKGSRILVLSSTAGVRAGQVIGLDQRNDPSYVWVNGFGYLTGSNVCAVDGNSCGRNDNPLQMNGASSRAQSELVEIETVCTGPNANGCTAANQIIIKEPGLSHDYSLSLIPQAFYWNANGQYGPGSIRYAGVENMKINANNINWAISMPFCDFCWVKNVAVINIARGGVYFHWSYKNEIRDSYISRTNGSGASQQYGLEILSSTFTKGENNIFFGITAPLMPQASYGLVMGYNYALNTSSGNQFADFEPHLAHNFLHLYEGNAIHRITYDNAWGSASQGTMFRNRIAGPSPNKSNYRSALQIASWNYGLNVVGNVLGNPSFATVPYSCDPNSVDTVIYDLGYWNSCIGEPSIYPHDPQTEASLMRWGNWDAATYKTNGNTNGIRYCTGNQAGNPACTASETASSYSRWPGLANPSTVLPASFYLTGRPSWFGSVTWPPIGPEVQCSGVNCAANAGNHAYKIPAQLCYESSPKDAEGFITSFNPSVCYGNAVLQTVTVSKSGTGTGTVSGAGITCGFTCSTQVVEGSSITLTAAPDPTSTFAGWGGACSGTSTTCTLTVSAARNVTATFNALPVSAPTISTQPTNQSAMVGQTATFSVVATGNPAPSYQWQRNGVNITGANSSTYTTPTLALTDNGAMYRVLVSNTQGSAPSNAATLTVTAVSSKFVIGDRIVLVQDSNVRSAPTINSSNVIGSHIVGETGRIEGGPIEDANNPGVIFWYINYDTGVDGWSGHEDRFDKVTSTPSTKFNINDRVQVLVNLNVRQSADSTAALSIGTPNPQPIGALGTVVGGPTLADGLNWWNINYDTGADGWSAEASAGTDYLVKYTSGGGTIRNAVSCSQTDVQNAVNASADGDTVRIPAGTCTWSTRVTVPAGRAVSVIGAGKNSTIITNTAGTAIRWSGTVDKPFRLSGIRFNNSDNQSPIISLVGPMYKARIDNCYINKGDNAIGTNDDVDGTGPVYGVVDHCDFYNMKRPYFAQDNRTTDGSDDGITAWNQAIVNTSTGATDLPGTDKMMVFEDNNFVWDSNLTDSNAQGAFYGQYGGKATLRRNNFTGFCIYIDAHGDLSPGGGTGTIFYEMYHNTFVKGTSNCDAKIAWQRGGQWIVHNNTFTTNPGYDAIRLSVYYTSDNVARRIKNSYFWSNTYNGDTNQANIVKVVDSGQTSAGYSAANIRLGQEYFLAAPQPGQVYYPYNCLAYPHPLVQTQDGVGATTLAGCTSTSIPDDIPPSTPGIPTVTVTSNSVTLNWTASTDTGGSGLAGYRIYRAAGTGNPTTLVGTSATNSYQDNTVSPSTTYTYNVEAYDNAATPNVSTRSGNVTVTTGAVGTGNNYWVDDNGSATWTNCRSATPLSGTAACSLATANTSAVAGDTINIRGGNYSTRIAPSANGTSDSNRITYVRYASEQPIFSVNVSLTGKSYITIDGVTIIPNSCTGAGCYVYLSNSHHINVQNSTMTSVVSQSGWTVGMSLHDNSHHNILRNSVIGNTGNSANLDDQGGVIDIGRESATDLSDYNLIEGNTIYHGGHHVLYILTNNNIVKNNTIYNDDWMTCSKTGAGGTCGNRNILIDSSAATRANWNVIENNRIAFAGEATDDGNDNAPGISLRAGRNIIRGNQIYNNGGSGISLEALDYWGGPQETRFNHIYNNTMFHNGYTTLPAADSWSRHGIMLANQGGGAITDQSIVNNIFWNHQPCPGSNCFGGIHFYVANRSSQAVVANNLEESSNPQFVNASLGTPGNTTTPDLRISNSNSPVVNAGRFLTTTSSSGSGTNIPVVDAAYFTDGYGITQGDLIQLQGQTTTARITAINYTTNTITVNTSLTWTSGLGVALPYHDVSPDIGAFEYTGPITQPTDATLTVSKSGTGTGTVTGTGINCGSDCDETVNIGASITITATPTSGHTFGGFTGCSSVNGTSCTVVLNNDTTVLVSFTAPAAVPPLMPGLTFEAEAGLIEAPFTSAGGLISQSTATTDPTVAGKASYRFTIPQTGNYIVKMMIDAANEGADSVFVNIDGEPTTPTMIWDVVPLTTGVQERTLSWRGSSVTAGVAEFNPKVFSLSAGEHTLIIRGREASTEIDRITIEAQAASTKFTIGQRVSINGTNVQVRSTPGGISLGAHNTGDLGTVQGGPQVAALNGTSYVWWNVTFDSAPSGWVAEQFVDVYTAPGTGISCDLSTLQAAINNAAAGSTITCNTGTWSWSSTLNITKPITILGSGVSTDTGTNRTRINNTSGSTLININPTTDGPIRISNLYLDNSSATGAYIINIQGRDYIDRYTTLNNVRIDNNVLNKGKRQLHVAGDVRGVADHNLFLNGDISVGFEGSNNNSWSRPIVPGLSTDTFVVEDNTFTVDANVGAAPGTLIYHEMGARSVVRNNTFDSRTSPYDVAFYEEHGNQDNPYTGDARSDSYRGQPLVELYGNTFRSNNTRGDARIIYFRGGSILAYNNTATCQSACVMEFTEEEGWNSVVFRDTTYPGQDQINNSFFWNNTKNGQPFLPELAQPIDQTFIQEGRDYWLHPPCNGTDCGTWPTTWGTSGGRTVWVNSSQPGVAVQCFGTPEAGTGKCVTGANAYYPYVPLAYPHPLVSGVTPQNYTLTVNKQGTGTGTVSSNVGGISNCSTICTSTALTSGTSITLTASPAANTTVTWNGCTANGNTCTLTLNSNSTVTATYTSTQSGVLIAPDRRTDWSQAGANIIDRTVQCGPTIAPYSGAATAINTAIQNCPAGQFVQLGAGTFNLSNGIVFDSKSNVTLRGMGPDQTTLVFTGDSTCAGPDSLICVRSSDVDDVSPDHVANWTGGYQKGNNIITLSSVTGLAVGQLIMLDQVNETSDPGQVWNCSANGVCTYGGPGGAGRRNPIREQIQIGRVLSCGTSTPGAQCTSTTVTLETPIHAPNWRASQNPQAWWTSDTDNIENVGIEDLKINGNAIDTNHITLMYAYNSWVKNVWSEWAGPRSHVRLWLGKNLTVRDSYFFEGNAHGSQSYGVEYYMTSDSLVENNIFQRVTAPIIVNGPVSGSVAGYNYSREMTFTNPPWMIASNTYHASGANMMLTEGNEGNAFMFDNVHGPGALMTVFRNRFTGWESGKSAQTTPIHIYHYNRFFNIIGNVLGTDTYHQNYECAPATATTQNCSPYSENSIYNLGWSWNGGQIDFNYTPPMSNDLLTKSTSFRWGNYDTVTDSTKFDPAEVPTASAYYPNPVPSSQTLPASLYLSGEPTWWPNNIPFPPIGPDVTGGPEIAGHVYKNPARACFDNTAKAASGALNTFNANNCYNTIVGTTYTITATAGSNGSISPSGSVVVAEGGSRTFTVTPNTGYQVDTVLVNGSAATLINNQYTFTNVTSNRTISVTFRTLPLSAPTIITQPQAQTVVAGNTATFSVTAQGNPAPTYQWQRAVSSNPTSFSNISGATSASYTTGALTVAANNGDQYRVIVSNNQGSPITSSAAALTVNPVSTKFVINDRIILTQITAARDIPAISGSVNRGNHAIGERGTIVGGPVSDGTGVWWQINYDVDPDGWSGYEDRYEKDTIVPDNIPPSTPGTPTAPNPSSNSVTLNWTASTDTGGSGLAGYRIYRATGTGNPTTLVGTSATNSYQDNTVSASTQYTYNVEAYDNANPSNVSTRSGNRTVTTPAITQAPVISTEPISSTVNVGGTATFTVVANGLPSPSYQWQKRASGFGTFVDISGATSATYTTGTLVMANSGDSYRVIVSNTAGSVQSSIVNVTVIDNVAPGVPGTPTATASSNSVSLSWTASADNSGGTGLAGYRIYRANGSITPTVLLTTVATNSYTDNTVSPSTSYTYAVSAIDSATPANESAKSGNRNISTAALGSAPVISLQPTSATINIGGTATFIVAATGVPAPSYQWQRRTSGGSTFSDVSGATSATYTTGTLSVANNGDAYQVVVSNASGSVTSSIVTITVIDDVAPSVSITLPQNNATVSGGSVTLAATASDNVGVASVQFSVDGTNIPNSLISVSPYQGSWDTRGVSNGAHVITATARDTAGNTNSSSVNVTVNNITPDVTPPTVFITSPISDSTVSGTIAIDASALDPIIAGAVTSGLAGVQFKIGNQNLGVEDTTVPYSVSWDTTAVANGRHSVSAVARDRVGLITTSLPVGVNVSNPVQGLTIGNATMRQIDRRRVQISWTTNIPASAAVDYGLSTSYGTTIANPLYSNSHTIITPSLPRGSTFYFRIRAATQTGLTDSLATSLTVKNKPSGIVNISAANGSVILTWENPVDLDFTEILIFRAVGSVPISDPSGEPFAVIVGTTTSIYHDGSVEPATTYSYSIFTRDDDGATSDVVSTTFTTDAEPVAEVPPPPSGGGGGSRPISGGGSFNPILAPATGTFTPDVPQPCSVPAAALAQRFNRILKIGDRGDDVKALQVFLNTNGFTVALVGTGSRGLESTYYGPATAAAVKKFQEAYRSEVLAPGGLVQGTGSVGNLTRAKLNALTTTTTPSAQNCAPAAFTPITPTLVQASTTTTLFTRNLTVGARGEDVRQLQIFLNTRGFAVAATGTGSRGFESTFFGPATRSALARFQSANGIVPAQGFFGPLTRAKVNGLR